MNSIKNILSLVFCAYLLSSTTTHFMNNQAGEVLYSLVAGAVFSALAFLPVRYFISDEPYPKNEKRFIGMGIMVALGGIAFKYLNGAPLRHTLGNSPLCSFLSFVCVSAYAVFNSINQ